MEPENPAMNIESGDATLKLLFALFLTICFSPSLTAQSLPKYEVFGGYSLEHISTCGSDDATCSFSSDGPASIGNFNGWSASFTGYFYKFLGLTGEFGNHRGSSFQVVSSTNVSRYSYMGGPVVALRKRTATVYSHVLFGGVSNDYTGPFKSSYNTFAWAVGGGLDADLNRRFAIKLAEFNYEWVHTPVSSGSLPSVSGFTYSGGIVFRF
jgi:hypothetical protein